jgi:hypothetical protein
VPPLACSLAGIVAVEPLASWTVTVTFVEVVTSEIG